MSSTQTQSRNGKKPKPSAKQAKAPKPDPRAREVRRRILTRWIELAEDLTHLNDAIRKSPKGTFTPDELQECDFAMDQVWSHMNNDRPKLDPSGAERRARWARYLERVSHRAAVQKAMEESPVMAALEKAGAA